MDLSTNQSGRKITQYWIYVLNSYIRYTFSVEMVYFKSLHVYFDEHVEKKDIIPHVDMYLFTNPQYRETDLVLPFAAMYKNISHYLTFPHEGIHLCPEGKKNLKKKNQLNKKDKNSKLFYTGCYFTSRCGDSVLLGGAGQYKSWVIYIITFGNYAAEFEKFDINITYLLSFVMVLKLVTSTSFKFLLVSISISRSMFGFDSVEGRTQESLAYTRLKVWSQDFLNFEKKSISQ